MTREVSQWAREQLLQARQKKESQRQHLRAAVAFREEELGAPLPIVTVTLSAVSTATASNVVAPTGTTHVPFDTSTSIVLCTPPAAKLATNQLIAANAIHSQYHRRDAPTSWSTLVDHVQSLSMTSSLLSTQPLPTLRVKKLLHFKEQKEKRRGQAKRGLLWRYASDAEETAEDRQRAEVEELVLLEHHTPITRCALHAFLTSSGPMSLLDSSPSTSGTTDEK